MYLLDIGGGFPGSEDGKLKFEEVIHGSRRDRTNMKANVLA